MSGVQKKWVSLWPKQMFAYFFQNAVIYDLFRCFTPNVKRSARPFFSTCVKFLEIYVWTARGMVSTWTRSSSKIVSLIQGSYKQKGQYSGSKQQPELMSSVVSASVNDKNICVDDEGCNIDQNHISKCTLFGVCRGLRKNVIQILAQFQFRRLQLTAPRRADDVLAPPRAIGSASVQVSPLTIATSHRNRKEKTDVRQMFVFKSCCGKSQVSILA